MKEVKSRGKINTGVIRFTDLRQVRTENRKRRACFLQCAAYEYIGAVRRKYKC